jgi:hypothetical protein
LDKKIQDNVASADISDETNRLKLSQNDLEILEKYLLNPNPPNEALKKAAEKYSEKVRENHTHINDFEISEEKLKQKEALIEMMENDQKLGLYDEPFDNPMVKEEDDNVSDWDATLMDGLEDEPSFFTDEEIENILQQEPTEEEIQQNFSTITPESTNIFQEEYVPSLSDEEIMEMNQQEYERNLDSDEFISDAINEFNQQSIEDEFDVPAPEEAQKFNFEESVKEYFEEPPIEVTDENLGEDNLYEEVEEDHDEDELKKKS